MVVLSLDQLLEWHIRQLAISYCLSVCLHGSACGERSLSSSSLLMNSDFGRHGWEADAHSNCIINQLMEDVRTIEPLFVTMSHIA